MNENKRTCVAFAAYGFCVMGDLCPFSHSIKNEIENLPKKQNIQILSEKDRLDVENTRVKIANLKRKRNKEIENPRGIETKKKKKIKNEKIKESTKSNSNSKSNVFKSAGKLIGSKLKRDSSIVPKPPIVAYIPNARIPRALRQKQLNRMIEMSTKNKKITNIELKTIYDKELNNELEFYKGSNSKPVYMNKIAHFLKNK